MSQRALGFAIIGTGMIAHFHARAIEAASRTRALKLCGVYARVPDAAASFAAQHAIPLHTDRLEVLLAQPGIDVVCIATPSGAHLEPALAAIAAGKHVVVEKPLEISLARIDKMIAAAAVANVHICAISQARFSPAAQTVKAALDAGRFGPLCLCSAFVKWHRAASYYQGWKGTWALDGGGAVMNQSIHALDLLRWFAGPPSDVFAWKTRRTHQHIEAEDTACASLRFQNGALGVFEATTGAWPGWERRIEICGQHGSAAIEDEQIARWDFVHPQPQDAAIRAARAHGADSGGASAPDSIGFRGHQRQIEQLADAILEGGPVSIDGSEARRTVALVLDIYRSSRLGLPVRSE